MFNDSNAVLSTTLLVSELAASLVSDFSCQSCRLTHAAVLEELRSSDTVWGLFSDNNSPGTVFIYHLSHWTTAWDADLTCSRQALPEQTWAVPPRQSASLPHSSADTGDLGGWGMSQASPNVSSACLSYSLRCPDVWMTRICQLVVRHSAKIYKVTVTGLETVRR